MVLPDIWRPIVEHYCPQWHTLDKEARLRLEQVILDLIADKRWESVRDLELTDEMIVAIAAQAAVPVREIGVEHYRRIRSILIAPGAMRAAGTRSGPAGTRMSGRTTVVGEAHHDGLIRLSWTTVRQDARFPARGRNVVIHEFAHQLDLLDGWIDGTPPLPGIDGEHWVEVCTRRMDEVRRGDGSGLLRSYAGTGPGEFFAVASEAFFTIPDRMATDLADLYELLAAYYRQDPRHQRGSDPI